MGCFLKAYKVSNTTGWEIEPAGGKREWMDQSNEKFAYRCLPLVMANQAGWLVSCPLNFSAIWDGGMSPSALKLRFPEGEGSTVGHIKSHFGGGILTFSLPWLFRTSPGYGLWVRGPANVIKDNALPLDGIVETDWAPYTFTMNWRVMRRNTEVFFKRGEPVCMLVPFPLSLLEEVVCSFENIDDDPVLKQDFFQFTSRRSGNIELIKATNQTQWSMDYMKGHLPDGAEVNTHRKAFRLKEFSPAPPPKSPVPHSRQG